MEKPGGRRQQMRLMPSDFAEQSRSLTRSALAILYNTSWAAVNRWISEAGTTPVLATPYNKGRNPCPPTFSIHAPAMRNNELMALYGAKADTITRWRKETGCLSPKGQASLRKKAAKAEKVKRQSFKRQEPTAKKYVYFGGPKPAPATPIDSSLAAQAARYLMRDYRPVCRRSTVEPKADKDLWVVGRQTLTTAELIAKAESKGFSSRVAA